jgi:ABC-2 type transport system permease protein
MKEKKRNILFQWPIDMLKVAKREMRLVFADVGVVIFFFVLCAVYPLLYSLIYNTEVVRDVHVAVVDNCRSQESRELVRHIDATPEVEVVAYAANMQEAQRLLHEKKVYGILSVPRDFSQCVGRGEQAHLDVYCDMSVMLRYKNLLLAVTNVTQDLAARSQAAAVAPVIYNTGSIVESRQVPIGNTAMGIASAILLFILPLVVQQSMVLGIGMLHGGSFERRVHNLGYDPREVPAGVIPTVLGKTVCYAFMYVLPVIYVLHFTPSFFSFPQHATLWSVIMLALPFVLAVAFMGQAFMFLIRERESVFLFLAFTSVIFVFLSGVSWPRFQMSTLWQTVGDFIPSTWMSNAYALMQSDGASLADVAHHVRMLWLLAGVYFVLACVTEGLVLRPYYRNMQARAAIDPSALYKGEAERNGVDIVSD